MKKQFTLPNYYSVIPANVRYCPDLTFFEIVLYSEISALSNALGFCYASNSYFAKLYNKDVRTIIRAINNLRDKGFIRSEIEEENGNLRKIFIVASENNVTTPSDKNVTTPSDKNVIENNTSDNITSYINNHARESVDIVELFKKVYKGPKWNK